MSPDNRRATRGNVLTTLPAAMTGRARPRKGRGPRQAGLCLHQRLAAAPIGMGKDSRVMDLASLDDIDERQLASWMIQATAVPDFGGKKR
jgi:hypothetical protein